MPDLPSWGELNAHGQVALTADAHGRAALLLVESLIHGLVNRSILPLADAIEIVDIAAEIELELGRSGPIASNEPHSLLAPIATSLRFDLRG